MPKASCASCVQDATPRTRRLSWAEGIVIVVIIITAALLAVMGQTPADILVLLGSTSLLGCAVVAVGRGSTMRMLMRIAASNPV